MSTQEKPTIVSFGSLIRRQSSGVSQFERDENDDSDSKSISEAGDIGDRSLRCSSSRRHMDDSGVVVSHVGEVKNDKREVPKLLEYVSCLAHLAVFGILGVLTRYSLQKLFGPGMVGLTSNDNILYLDLPSNVAGSFLMGWFGVVFKEDISGVSEFLAIGLTTGYLGSLTTFSGWNQKMLELCVEGRWALSILGFVMGLALAAGSISFGVETAKGVRKIIEKKLAKQKQQGSSNPGRVWRVDSCERHMWAFAVFVLILCLLWGACSILLRYEFSNESKQAQLWLACLVGPFGVWIRWFLARLNGRGLGKGGRLKWVPFGTLLANVSACCAMAALATTTKAVNTKTCNTVTTGLQLGFLGCLSTVSTFIAEYRAMRASKCSWRAHVYAIVTICYSFVLGILIYCVPIWANAIEK